MSAPQSTRVSCPQCRQPVAANILSIIDVGQQPALKTALLRGQINAIQCPSCGYRGALATPLLYHDPAKQLALMLMPLELGLRRDEEEKTIGRLSNALVATIPNEQRKMYMFQPRTILSLQRLIEEIMEADGISKETLDKQAAQMRLLQELVSSANDDAAFKQVAQANRAQIEQPFVDMIAAIAQETAAEGDPENGQKLLSMAALLAQELSLKAPGGQRTVSMDELLQALREAQDNEPEFRELVATIKPALDYQFYQALAAKIDAATGDEAKALKQLRAKLLVTSEEIEREAEAMFSAGNQLLQEILQSADMRQAVSERLAQLDDAFLMVLQANMQQAAQQKQESAVKVLSDIYQEVVAQMEAKMPAELQQVNQLLRLPPGERAELFRAQPQLVTVELLGTIATLANDLQQQGRAEIAQEMIGLMNQAAAWAPPNVAAQLQRRAPAIPVAAR